MDRIAAGRPPRARKASTSPPRSTSSRAPDAHQTPASNPIGSIRRPARTCSSPCITTHQGPTAAVTCKRSHHPATSPERTIAPSTTTRTPRQSPTAPLQDAHCPVACSLPPNTKPAPAQIQPASALQSRIRPSRHHEHGQLRRRPGPLHHRPLHALYTAPCQAAPSARLAPAAAEHGPEGHGRRADPAATGRQRALLGGASRRRRGERRQRGPAVTGGRFRPKIGRAHV